MGKQDLEVEQVATAMNEMTSTVLEVASNTAFTADATQKADNEVRSGKAIVDETISSIRNMAGKVEDSVSVIKRLAQDSEQINGVVDVIRNVAEQTNLLALNAAIEAAQAGVSLNSIFQAVDTISQMSTQIATAAEQQSAVSDEINQNIISISASTTNTIDMTHQSSQANHKLTDEITRLQTMVTQFGIGA